MKSCRMRWPSGSTFRAAGGRTGLNESFQLALRLRTLGIPRHKQAKASKELCLRPSMHGSVVPTQKKTSAAERSIRLLPDGENVVQHAGQEPVQCGATAFQQCCQVNALRVVVKLAAINRQTRPTGKGFW